MELSLAPRRSAPTATSVACPACGDRREAPLFRVLDHGYVACPTCGLAHLDPIPTPDAQLAHFERGYFEGGEIRGGYDDYAGDEALHRANARARLAVIEQFRDPAPGAWLDIGCAYGYAADEARRAGWQVAGVEPSSAAATTARTLGLDVFATPADACAARPEGFDVVSMCQVLSHVTDPAAAVRDATACLRPGGLLFVETWRRDALVARIAGRRWHVIIPPTVVWLETSTSISRLLDGAGLLVIDARTGRKRVSVGLVSSLLADRPGDGLVARATRFAADAGARRSIVYALPDLTWVTAVRP